MNTSFKSSFGSPFKEELKSQDNSYSKMNTMKRKQFALSKTYGSTTIQKEDKQEDKLFGVLKMKQSNKREIEIKKKQDLKSAKEAVEIKRVAKMKIDIQIESLQLIIPSNIYKED